MEEGSPAAGFSTTLVPMGCEVVPYKEKDKTEVEMKPTERTQELRSPVG